MTDKDKHSKHKSADLDQLNSAKNGRTLYENFLKLPESKTKKHYQSIKDERFKLSDQGMKIDLRPRKFFSIMKVEIILLTFGVGFAISK